jgi:hypothetical protein
MEDIQKLWEHGVNVWVEYKKPHFNLKTIIFCMINDNLECLALTVQVKGKTTCIICVDHMKSICLPSSSKLVDEVWYHGYTTDQTWREGQRGPP